MCSSEDILLVKASATTREKILIKHISGRKDLYAEYGKQITKQGGSVGIGICNTQKPYGGRRHLEVVLRSSHVCHGMYSPHTFTHTQIHAHKINREKEILGKKLGMVAKVCKARIQEAKAGG